ncbi:MAG: peptide chain release factor N(5)-glutamine methyltransferase [Clostridia bacterium]|nr:peptide chain release factor N(5)-glutamine methyltransferase [Clostridia bacterium]
MNQKELLFLGKEKLEKAKVEEAHSKAKKLLQYLLNQNTQQFLIYSLEQVSKEKELKYEKKLQEIIEGKPLQYITNCQEFMGLDFYVDENVLIPQPDTEILVEAVLEILKKETKPVQVLDLCTGSGVIGVSIAKKANNIKAILSDISKEALKIAEKNAKQNKVEEKIELIYSNMFEQIEGKFKYIVSNPPYIETNAIESLPNEVKQEPYIALNGGKDGLNFYRIILETAYSYLEEDGYLVLEIGYDQKEKIRKLYEQKKSYYRLVTKEPIKDFGGNDRVMIFQKKEKNS